jgi:hypothetical protein
MKSRILASGFLILLITIIWPWYPAPPAPSCPTDMASYAGPLPSAMLLIDGAIIYAAAILAVRHQRKLAFAAALSLMAASTVAALWTRDLRTREMFQYCSYELHPEIVAYVQWSLDSEAGGMSLNLCQREEAVANGFFESRRPLQWYRDSITPIYPLENSPVAGQHGWSHTWHRFQIESTWRRDSVSTIHVPRYASVTFPDSAAFLALAFVPTLWLARAAGRWRTRRRRKLTGCCVNCGYSLTGNQSGTCPECGMPAVLVA